MIDSLMHKIKCVVITRSFLSQLILFNAEEFIFSFFASSISSKNEKPRWKEITLVVAVIFKITFICLEVVFFLYVVTTPRKLLYWTFYANASRTMREIQFFRKCLCYHDIAPNLKKPRKCELGLKARKSLVF